MYCYFLYCNFKLKQLINTTSKKSQGTSGGSLHGARELSTPSIARASLGGGCSGMEPRGRCRDRSAATRWLSFLPTPGLIGLNPPSPPPKKAVGSDAVAGCLGTAAHPEKREREREFCSAFMTVLRKGGQETKYKRPGQCFRAACEEGAKGKASGIFSSIIKGQLRRKGVAQRRLHVLPRGGGGGAAPATGTAASALPAGSVRSSVGCMA